jgi:hypothetical protein
MSITFVNALQNNIKESVTNNGMVTLENSGDACVNLFFAIGSSRGKDITAQFERAYQENPLIAIRILFWARDIRGGAGERQTFKNLLTHIAKLHSSTAKSILEYIPEYGRWDDIFAFIGTTIEDNALNLIVTGLNTKNGLCAKWVPRKGPIAKLIRKNLGLNERDYRKLVVSLTNVVETKMCAKKWNKIEYDHVPSVASARYQKAFNKNDTIRYQAYKEGLDKGTSNIHASAVYPYDVIKSVSKGDSQVAIHQWESLPNYLGDNKIIPMVDTSGSMYTNIPGSKLQCIDISVSLGLYIADKQTGAFKDLFLTFNTNSKLELLKGNLLSKLSQLQRADWGGSTNLESAFNEILQVAIAGNLHQDELPSVLLIFSDMEFNQATSNYSGKSIRAQDMAKEKFAMAGYTIPKIVYWQLNGKSGNVPVKFNEQGTALVSGFSPAIMKSILSASNFTPETIMLETINSERYKQIEITN